MGTDETDGVRRRPAPVRAAGRAGRVLAGGAGLAVRGLTDLVKPPRARDWTADGRVGPPPPPAGRGETGAIAWAAAGRLGEAALGLAALTSRRVLDVAAGVAMPMEAAASVTVRAGAFVAGRTGLAGRIDRLAGVGREQQRRNEGEAALLLRTAWRRSVARVVEETDVDAVLDEVDVNGIVRRVDVDAIVGRVDLDTAVSRVDVDEVVQRVDLDAVVTRLRVPELVERVLDDIDLGRIVRESSAGMAAETVDAVRARSADADRVINGFVDRVVLRRAPRDTVRTPADRPREVTAGPANGAPPADGGGGPAAGGRDAGLADEDARSGDEPAAGGAVAGPPAGEGPAEAERATEEPTGAPDTGTSADDEGGLEGPGRAPP
ncbi:hypothetical protein [Jiangella endophytica]|uniref:hypothetical protein n=1 Tax=Jiangella endophytica TaxID=1623398 RepID=UPI0013004E8E|nr:hypothetical protein [Jiangella endophytica]